MSSFSKDKYWDLGIPVKSSTGTGDNQKPKAIIGNREHRWESKTPDGKLTFWGVYLLLILKIQNERKWIPTTCANYDSLVCNTLAPAFMKENPAFEELTEDEILLRWQGALNQISSESTAQSCYRLLRTIMMAAYERGYTRTLLWGMVNPCRDAEVLTEEEANGEDTLIKTLEQQEEADEREGKRYAQKLNNKICILPETEYRIYRYCEQESMAHGEYLGGMIGLETGNRTSEICGYSYGDLDQLGSNYTLRTINTADISGRKIHKGGKTSNAYRGLVLSDHLISILLERKERIKATGMYKDVDKLPIVCVGTDYEKRCTQKELNRAMKDAFYQCKIESDVMREASATIRDDPELAAECESSASVYLFRHLRVTWAVACGYSQAEIYNVAGHKINVPNVDKSDFSNPDRFERQVELDRIRPLKQILDNTPIYDEVAFEGTPIRAASLGGMQIRISAGSTFQLTAQAIEPGTQITVDVNDSIELNNSELVLPPINPRHEISMRELFHACSQGIRESDASAIFSRIVEADDEDNAFSGELCLSASAQKALIMHQSSTSQVEESNTVDTAVDNKTATYSMCSDASSDIPPCEEYTSDSAKEDDDKQQRIYEEASIMPTAKAASPKIAIKPSFDIWYLLNNRLVPIAEEALVLGKIGQAGTKGIVLDKKERIAGVCIHDARYGALLLSTDCTAYRIPAGVRLDEYLSGEARKQQLLSLCHGGLIVPLTDNTPDLVLVSRSGRIRTIPASQVAAITEKGRGLPGFGGEQHSADTLASAYFSAKDADQFLVGSNGKALRLFATDIFRTDSARNASKQGIDLDAVAGAYLAAAFPYPANGSTIATSKFGMAARISFQDVQPHHNGSQGSDYFCPNESDCIFSVCAPSDILMLVRSDGHVLCFETAETLMSLGRGAKGRRAMKLKSGQYIVAALPLHGELQTLSAQFDKGA